MCQVQNFGYPVGRRSHREFFWSISIFLGLSPIMSARRGRSRGRAHTPVVYSTFPRSPRSLDFLFFISGRSRLVRLKPPYRGARPASRRVAPLCRLAPPTARSGAVGRAAPRIPLVALPVCVGREAGAPSPPSASLQQGNTCNTGKT